MKTRAAMAATAILLALGCAPRPEPAPLTKGATVDIRLLDTEALLKKLMAASERSHGIEALASIAYFIPTGESADDDSFTVSDVPYPYPPLKELVNQGARAVPILLEHLDDRTPTDITIAVGQRFGTQEPEPTPFYIEYARRPQALELVQRGFDSPQGMLTKKVSSYTLRVGDICYFALGQIVNRPYEILKPLRSKTVLVNSPLERRELVKSARAEWTGFTPDKHFESLKRDFDDPPMWMEPREAWVRLRFYYQDAMQDYMAGLMSRPPYDDKPEDYLWWKLIDAKSTEQQRRLISAFKTQHDPEAVEHLAYRLYDDIRLTEGRYDLIPETPQARKDALADAAKTRATLRNLFPNFAPSLAGRQARIGLDRLQDLISDSYIRYNTHLESNEFDLFQRVRDLPKSRHISPLALDKLAVSIGDEEDARHRNAARQYRAKRLAQLRRHRTKADAESYETLVRAERTDQENAQLVRLRMRPTR